MLPRILGYPGEGGALDWGSDEDMRVFAEKVGSLEQRFNSLGCP